MTQPILPPNSEVYIVWSGSLKVHGGVLTKYTEAVKWVDKVEAMGKRASIEILVTDNSGKVIY